MYFWFFHICVNVYTDCEFCCSEEVGYNGYDVLLLVWVRSVILHDSWVFGLWLS